MYEILASPFFKITLKRLIDFITAKHSKALAEETRQFIKKAILDNLPTNPYFAPVGSRLIDLGIKEYRQYQIDQHNTVFYRVYEAHKVFVLLAVMDRRQSIQKLLSEVLLLA